jgi:uncharacterized cupredoxin-like copper-binding protein
MYAYTRRPLAGAAIVLVSALALAACGSSSDSSTSSSAAGSGGAYGSASTKTAATTTTAAAAPAAGGASTVKLSADPDGALAFVPTTLTAKAGKVTLDMTNPSSSGLEHAIAVEGNGVDKDGATVQPGGSSKVTITLKPGTYEFYCPVPGHKAAGMKGTLTVS